MADILKFRAAQLNLLVFVLNCRDKCKLFAEHMGQSLLLFMHVQVSFQFVGDQ